MFFGNAHWAIKHQLFASAVSSGSGSTLATNYRYSPHMTAPAQALMAQVLGSTVR